MALLQEDLDNRFSHHETTGDTNSLMEQVRARALDLAEDLNVIVPDGREKSLALTHLEEVMFWANAGIARNPQV